MDAQELAETCKADAVFLGQSMKAFNLRSMSDMYFNSPYHESHCSPRSLRRVKSRKVQGQLQNQDNDHSSRHFKLQGLVRNILS